jgi:amidohydrolase
MNRMIKKLVPELIALRRDFHQYPELGFKEFATQKKIITYLDNVGVKAKKIAKTGVVGALSGNRQGRTILLRSDMDALPVQEETNLEFQSKNSGIMHACGHDGHMAMLLVAAKLLAQFKENIAGNIILAFQPNEEDAGAYKMIEENIIEDFKVDAAFGCHLWNQLETGKIDICDGPAMAASHYFYLTIKGVGGHAGFAHESIDPIFISSHIIQAVQSIQTRQINALNPAVIMFTSIHGGTNTTIIPEKTMLQGSIRFLYENGEDILKKFEQVVNDICNLHGAGYELEFKTGNDMLSNDPSIAGIVRKAASSILKDEKKVTTDIRTMAGEDFSEFAARVPAAFAFVGAKNKSQPIVYPHHHPQFDLDEDALVLGSELYIKVALNYLKEIF